MEYRKSDFEDLNPCVSKIKIHEKTSDFQLIVHEKYNYLHSEAEKKLFFKEE